MAQSRDAGHQGIPPDGAPRRKRRALIRASTLTVLAAAAVGWTLWSGAESSPPTAPAAPDVPRPVAACGAKRPPKADPRQYERPEEVLDAGVDYRAEIVTSCGTIELDLLEDEAREAVNSFVFLARRGFYDGLIWHRVEKNHIIQTGDPNGDARKEPNGPGYSVYGPYPDGARRYVYGTAALANQREFKDTGSQFFIVVHKPTTPLSGRTEPAGLHAQYTIFGHTTRGSVETLDAIADKKTAETGLASEIVKPVVPVFVESVEILER
jgi:cyclophilin family peptidyl-prolyl cis-trans isomerase